MSERALVLGGGGSAGNAWEIGVVAGLSGGGLDATQADLIIGTSAGSTVAAQITGVARPADLLTAALAPPSAAVPSAAVPSAAVPSAAEPRPAATGRPVADHLERTGRIIAAASDAADMRRRMGAAALQLDAESDGSWSSRWRETVAARLAGRQWPGRDLLVTAVDARTGDPVVFDRHSGVDLVDAVAASTSSGAAYRIGDGRYIDGGYRRNENADLAVGHAQVLVLSPLGGRTRHPLEWRMQLAAQVEELRARGSRVETVLPDEASLEAFGGNMMDLTRRAPAARAGYEQGRALADALSDFWR